MPLPNSDLSGTVRRRAEYTDAVCFTTQLFRALPCPGLHDVALLTPEATSFWLEHSD